MTQAETYRDQLENELGEAVEAVGDATATAGKLKACFASDPDRFDEYKQATKWEQQLAFSGLADLLSQVSGDADEPTDDDAPMMLVLERVKVKWLKQLVEFARTIESADFQTDACDEVITDLESALA